MTFEITLNEDALEVLERKAKDESGSIEPESLRATLSDMVNDWLVKQAKTFARQRLNNLKKQIHSNINRGIRSYESLEQSYNTLGLGPDVQTFGGIREVYDKIWLSTGHILPENKIRTKIEFVKTGGAA
jgi:hypothetical protein